MNSPRLVDTENRHTLIQQHFEAQTLSLIFNKHTVTVPVQYEWRYYYLWPVFLSWFRSRHASPRPGIRSGSLHYIKIYLAG